MIYIALNGNDTWSGTLPSPNSEGTDGPLASLEQACETIQGLTQSDASPQPAITIYFREGTYPSFRLTEQHSGTQQAPICYRPFENERICLTGDPTQTSETPLIYFQDTHHIRIESFLLENTSGTGIQIEGGSNIHIAGCTVRNTGRTAIEITGGASHTVQSCDIHHTRGIDVQGGDRKTLTPCGHTLLNNHIHHTKETHPAIRLSGVGIRAAHNLIHDCPHSAILLKGNEHTIEYNHIHHVCQKAEGTGAFSMGGDWTERGNRLRHNFFHHTSGQNTLAVHLNDCASGTRVSGNIFYHCPRAIFIGGGRNHIVDNNIFVECQPAIHIDDRGTNPLFHDLVYKAMKPQFEAMNPLEPPYSEHYPELREVAMYYQADGGVPPEGNLISRNLVHHCEWLAIQKDIKPGLIAVQNNILDEDPCFVDPDHLNFQLRDNSPAYESGFKPILFENIGLYIDSYRTQLPGAK
ncbi:MAG: right-handed parallel beta-helix repeat-containing protein [bacterium]|nr:right-handed parallel beta-helix repeat-containing protein [bacterium]